MIGQPSSRRPSKPVCVPRDIPRQVLDIDDVDLALANEDARSIVVRNPKLAGAYPFELNDWTAARPLRTFPWSVSATKTLPGCVE
jgi:hypothetical protein